MARRSAAIRVGLAVAVCGAAGVASSPARASQLIDRNANGISLQVNASGQALLTYRSRGILKHVIAWGAVNAIAPTTARKQVAFKLDYAGGWGINRTQIWKTFKNACRPYDGPKLVWFVVGCTAPDGSYWAVQSWQKMLPNYGVASSTEQRAWELHLSHWTGEPAQLEVGLDYAYRRFHHLFGRLTYQGKPVYGFRSEANGNPLDTFGRNLYLDTFDSAYGKGWQRENSFLMHRGTGSFCYGFYPHGSRPPGTGVRYRATVIGPGVSPDVGWEGNAPGPYDQASEDAARTLQATLFAGDSLCKPL